MRRFLILIISFVALGCVETTQRAESDLGLKFSQIEVGTAYIFQNTDNGSRRMERYEGKNDGLHVFRSYFLDRNGSVTRSFLAEYYNNEGRRVRIENESFDHTFIFSPYDCVTGTTGTCAHQRTLFDSNTGARKTSVTKYFELSLSGDTLRVVRNAQGNRLRRTHVLNEANIQVSQKEPDPQFANNWVLVQTIAPR